jgi:hypothetical protein
MKISCDTNQVEFEGIIVPRPPHICPSRWYELWHEIKYDFEFSHSEGYRAGFKDGHTAAVEGRSDECYI